jgi:hypothetical protein
LSYEQYGGKLAFAFRHKNSQTFLFCFFFFYLMPNPKDLAVFVDIPSL